MNYSNINHLHLLEDRGSRELKNCEPFESTESEVEEGNLAKTLDDNTSLGSSELSGLNLPEFIRNIFDPDLESYFDKVVRRLALNYEPAVVSFMANASAALGGATRTGCPTPHRRRTTLCRLGVSRSKWRLLGQLQRKLPVNCQKNNQC